MSKAITNISCKLKSPPLAIAQLLTMPDKDLRGYITEFLAVRKIPTMYSEGDYIVTHMAPIGVKKPLVCVHLDTVSQIKPALHQLTLESKRVLKLSLQPALTGIIRCLGADDRAGVWIALELIHHFGLDCPYEFGFFDAEERGGIGSSVFADDIFELSDCPYQCFIGLDRGSRGGLQNIATYGYDNMQLLDLIQEAAPGYLIQNGSFSDCSNLSESFTTEGVPCFNLSVGYQNEHSVSESLDLPMMIETLELLKTPALIPIGVEFKAIPPVVYRSRLGWSRGAESDDTVYDLYPWLSDDEDTKEILSAYPESTPIRCEFCDAHAPLYEDTYGNLLCGNCMGRNF
jgi:hypothetical protein